jgi:diguanylate cyclase (GGDEF)-like protein
MLELLDQMADLSALRERDALNQALLNTIQQRLPFVRAHLCHLVGDLDNARWRVVAHHGHHDATDSEWLALESLPAMADHPQRGVAMRSQQVQQWHSAQTDHTIAAFPLTYTSGDHAVLEVETSGQLDDVTLQIMRSVLRLFRNIGNLLDYGERDSLTELLNRKTFDSAFLRATIAQQLATTLAAPEERRQPHTSGSYWLAVLDIDHFKRVNDNHGHLIGDEVLLLVARLMRRQFRHHDQLYRFGGEEFVVLMRCQGESEAADVLERMRAATAAYRFSQVGQITVSIGFAEVRQGDSPSGAFERADKAVYHAKGNGRNQVCSHAALVSQGLLTDSLSTVGEMELF